jgi:hypothetical protein
VGTPNGMIRAGRRYLGTTEHPPGSNYNPEIVGWYNEHIAAIGNGAWCDMSITREAHDSDNATAVCGGTGKGFAYVPSHAAWFAARGRFHTGTRGIRAGDIVFFRWDRRKGTTRCDHVGLVEKVNGDGTFYSLEGNTSDAFRRMHRDSTYVSGYGRPDYASTQEDDDMPIRTSLGKTKAQDLAWGKFTVLDWDTEYADPERAHADGSYPGYVAPISSWADFDAAVRVEGLAPGDEYQLRFEVHDWADGKSKGDPWTEIHADHPATNGVQFVAGTCSKGLTKGQHCYVAIAVFPAGGDPAGRPAPRAVSGRLTVRQDKS